MRWMRGLLSPLSPWCAGSMVVRHPEFPVDGLIEGAEKRQRLADADLTLASTRSGAQPPLSSTVAIG